MAPEHLLQTFQSVILINSSYRMSFTQTISDSLKNDVMFDFERCVLWMLGYPKKVDGNEKNYFV
jgi:hypothetical protein